jgi:hypothetical protein
MVLSVNPHVVVGTPAIGIEEKGFDEPPVVIARLPALFLLDKRLKILQLGALKPSRHLPPGISVGGVLGERPVLNGDAFAGLGLEILVEVIEPDEFQATEVVDVVDSLDTSERPRHAAVWLSGSLGSQEALDLRVLIPTPYVHFACLVDVNNKCLELVHFSEPSQDVGPTREGDPFALVRGCR